MGLDKITKRKGKRKRGEREGARERRKMSRWVEMHRLRHCVYSITFLLLHGVIHRPFIHIYSMLDPVLGTGDIA